MVMLLPAQLIAACCRRLLNINARTLKPISGEVDEMNLSVQAYKEWVAVGHIGKQASTYTKELPLSQSHKSHAVTPAIRSLPLDRSGATTNVELIRTLLTVSGIVHQGTAHLLTGLIFF